MDVEHSATYEALPAHVKPAWLCAVGALPPATGTGKCYHRPLKKVTNGQLSLEDFDSAISTKILSILKDFSMDEDRPLIDADLALDMNAFRDLVNVVSIDAIRRIEKEWLLLHELTNEAGTTDIDLGSCECELLLRFSLPCKHHLLQACQSARAAYHFPSHSCILGGGSKVLRFAAMRGSRLTLKSNS